MIKLLRLLQGYVIFEATGGFTERFLNLCKINNINLWNVENDGVKIKAFTTQCEFERINLASVNSGMSVNIVKIYGLPNFIKLHKWRFGVALGSFLTAVFLWSMSGFIWEVEIVADNAVKIEGFTEAVEELGVKVGAKKSDIDVIYIQEELLKTFPEISWVSLNIFGTKAQLEYSYAQEQTEIFDAHIPYNVVAKKSGLVVLVEAYTGTALAKAGAYIPKGALLISGVVINGDLTESITHAQGKVFARTDNEYEAAVKLNRSEVFVFDVKAHYKLNFFSIKIPIGLQGEGETVFSTDISLESNEATLPLGCVRNESFICDETSYVYSQKEGELEAFLSCISEKRGNYKDARLEKVTYVYSTGSEKAFCKMNVVCVENIATEQKMEIE